jgi:hypothetical protein
LHQNRLDKRDGVRPTPEYCSQYHPDDPDVLNATTLLRRVPQKHIIFDQNLGRHRPTSAAFEDDEDGSPMSTYRNDIIANEGAEVSRVMVGHDGYSLAGLTAEQFRSRQQTVHSDPLPEESSHTEICGLKTHGTRSWFAKTAEWIIPPEP